MFGLIFYLLMGFVSPSHSGKVSKANCPSTTNASISRGGPGGEIGDVRPR